MAAVNANVAIDSQLPVYLVAGTITVTSAIVCYQLCNAVKPPVALGGHTLWNFTPSEDVLCPLDGIAAIDEVLDSTREPTITVDLATETLEAPLYFAIDNTSQWILRTQRLQPTEIKSLKLPKGSTMALITFPVLLLVAGMSAIFFTLTSAVSSNSFCDFPSPPSDGCSTLEALQYVEEYGGDDE